MYCHLSSFTSFNPSSIVYKRYTIKFNFKAIEKQTKAQDERIREDRKDQRVDRQATHQKEMIDQRSEANSLKNFESSGNDILTGGANMGKYSR